MNKLFRDAEKANITVEYCRLPLCESVSAYDKAGDFILMDYSLINAGANERVHMAHELGHCATGSFYNQYAKADIRARHECRANKWAIKKLIPKDELMEKLASGYTEPWELAEQFDVTVPFMAMAMEYYQAQELN